MTNSQLKSVPISSLGTQLLQFSAEGRPKTASFRLSVLVPVYNERHLVEASLRRVLTLEHQLISSLEVIVVDDCSTDGTSEILKRLASEDGRIILIRHEENQGKGAAVRTGRTRQRHQFERGRSARSLARAAARHRAGARHHHRRRCRCGGPRRRLSCLASRRACRCGRRRARYPGQCIAGSWTRHTDDDHGTQVGFRYWIIIRGRACDGPRGAAA